MGGFLKIGCCLRTTDYCFLYCFLETFVGGQGLEGGRESCDEGSHSPPTRENPATQIFQVLGRGLL